MFAEPLQHFSTIDEKDEMNQPPIESEAGMTEVHSFQWFHIPTLLRTHLQTQQQEQNNDHFSQLLQRITTVLDECFDSHTPIPNKRLLHSSLSKLSQSPSLPPAVQRDVEKSFASLKIVEEGPIAVVETSQLDLIVSKEQTIAEQKQQLANQAQLEREVAKLRADKESFMSVVSSLQKEKEQIQKEKEELRSDLTNKTQKLEENERVIAELKQSNEQMKIDVARKEQFFVSSDIIVAFSPDYFQVNVSTVTRIHSSGWVGCFTKPVSKGIHRLSIKTKFLSVMIGVCGPAEYPKYLTSGTYQSPQAAMMENNGWLYSAGKNLAPNTIPREGQEWSVEANLEKRTLHFFINGVQQPHHFINIPVPLVFAIDVYDKDAWIEITYWGEEKQSHVTYQGTGHNLG
ncbi:hypothetical protein BLNAU_8432 [Blattamonas nauphoetae]|uniref:SPRY domain-containing protein n=1 Tax=Blattamonas nauphoetae TaxID=2049346 RepID=A0ABQ9XYM5_9EUKA|nr:hypothetical protein BLNAU_8432 [Blattamonas nauphoetae]